MPTSYHTQLNEIVNLIILTNPQSLLDVGVGHGKYGFLAREYLELWDGRTDGYRLRKRRIVGIELIESFLTPVHHYAYDHIHIGNAVDVVPSLSETYDLALLIDVIEHLDHQAGANLLANLSRIARNVIVSTPLSVKFHEPGEMDLFESPPHVSEWTRECFKGFEGAFFVPNPSSVICYFGQDAAAVRKQLELARTRRLKAKVYHYLPFLVPLAKLRRKLLGRSAS